MSRSRFVKVPSVIGPDVLLLDILARLQCRYVKGKVTPIQDRRFLGG
jgi:hypothetical protein